MFRTIIVSFGEIPDTIRRVFLLQNFVKKIVELIAADERSRSDYFLQSHICVFVENLKNQYIKPH